MTHGAQAVEPKLHAIRYAIPDARPRTRRFAARPSNRGREHVATAAARIRLAR